MKIERQNNMIRNSLRHRFVMCIALFMLSASVAVAQTQGRRFIDSLLQKLSAYNKEDSNKAHILEQLSFGYWYVDPDTGLVYGHQSLALAQKLGLGEIIASANSSIGGNYANKSDYANALKYEYEALKWYERSGNKVREITLLSNVGIVYRNKGEYAEALRYDSIALSKAEAIHDTDGISLVLGNIGNVYHRQKNYEKALEYFQKAVTLNEQKGRENIVAINLGNIGNVYADLGQSSKALEYYFKAIKIHEQTGNKGGVAINMGNMGETYLEIAKDTSRNIVSDSMVPAGRAANLAKAIDYLKRAIALSREINRLDYIVEYSSGLSEAYLMAGDHAAALEAYKQFVAVRDSVDNLENHKEFTKRQMDYEYGKREDEIKYRKKLSDQRYIAGLIVFAGISFFAYRNFRQQKRSNVIITKEKKRSDDLLLNILPAEVADELKNKGFADAKLFDDVTVFFSDFVGFTKVSERLTPQELIDELHACFKAFDAITSKYHIEKIKTIGDAYLAVAGLPAADPRHAANIVNAAIEIRDFMLDRHSKLGDRTFEIRIGVHSGSLVAGIVGIKKFAYDIWGDTVNTAARMEQNSVAGMINISHSTYELVKDEFTCTYRGEIQAKNKGALKMYFATKY